MSDDIVIRAENVSKRYQISHLARQQTLRDTMHHLARLAWRRLRWNTGDTREEFWALRDVDFEVKRGDVVGIIGHNGAGKSTLLKILSRITEPTTGRITLRGRVASLLEVGTGFHPELSGRDNIFLNGAILGMNRAEIRAKFDEIVAFAEIERFLDTPVKRYSSGMYVRLAFSVAAHLEPEILIVDEVLAVGDASFQKKCLGKMRSVSANQGRTVLFVSHNIHAVRQLCNKGLLLANGRVKKSGSAGEMLDAYLQNENAGDIRIPAPSAELLERAYTTGMTLETLDGAPATLFAVGQNWRARVCARLGRSYGRFVAGFGLVTADGVAAQTAWTTPMDLDAGDYEFSFEQNVSLQASSYSIVIGLSSADQSIQQITAGRIDISGEDPHGFFPFTSGVGMVLNSMKMTVRRI